MGICMMLISLLSIPAAFAAAAKKTVVQGKINMGEDYQLQVAALFPNSGLETEEIRLQADGSFSWTNGLERPTWVQFTFEPLARNRQLGASFPLYLQPGEQVQLHLHFDKDRYLQVLSGKLKGTHKSMIEYSSFCNQKMKERFLNKPAEADMEAFCQDYLDEVTRNVKRNKLKDKEVLDYLNFIGFNNYLMAVHSENLQVSLPEDCFETLDSEYALSNYLAMGNLNYLFERELPKNVGGFKRLQLKNDLLDKHVKLPALHQKLYLDYLLEFMQKYKITDRQQYAADIESLISFTQKMTDQKTRTVIIDDFKSLQYSTIGSAMPDVKFKDIEGKEVSLAQFKGKYVYIDLWASWCVPCIQEIPALQALEKQYKDKNIVFISLSLDSSKEAWRNKVAELNLHGLQWELGDSRFDKMMSITGIPHFMLYNPDGTLQLYKAPRPSDPQIKALFDKF